MRRARLLLLAFLTGACVMVAEIVAPRLVAPWLGTTALVWTTTIATFLGGIALGNAWGGRLADAERPWTLPVMLAAAAGALAATIPLNDGARALLGTGAWPHALRVLAGVPMVFLATAVALGLAGPLLARALLRASALPGRALGAVAAVGAVGSVVGTFAAGFALIPEAGTRAILLVTSAVLAVSAALSVGLGRDAPRRDTAPVRAPVSTARLGFLAALVGGAILSLEIGIGRHASDVVGNSVYTWTSVIGVVLVGLAAGNWLGGRLADRHEPRPLLSALLLAASAAVTVSLWMRAFVPPVLRADALPWALRALLGVAAAFLLPSVALGTISPVLVRAALADPRADGRTVGRLYALGSLGAVVGAALTGFVLIPSHGVTMLILLLAFALALAHAKVRGKPEVAWLATLAAIAALAALPVAPLRDVGLGLGLREDAPGTYVADSHYYRIRVRPEPWRRFRLSAEPAKDVDEHPLFKKQAFHERQRRVLYWRGTLGDEQAALLRQLLGSDADRGALDAFRRHTEHDFRVLILDKMTHGWADLEDPTWLHYDYEHVYASIVARAWPKEERPVGAFFIGGGSYTFQRRLVAQHGDGVRVVSAEIDPEVTRAGEVALGLAPGKAGAIWHGDARTYVDAYSPSDPRFHFVFGDAFNDMSVPWHLTTAEFARDLKRRMRPLVYMINVIDVFDSGRFLGAFVRALETQFPSVRVLTTAPRIDDARNTFVLVASDERLDLTDLRDEYGRPLDVIDFGPDEIAALRSRPGAVTLTDDHAPVESLLAPVVAERGSE